MPGLAARTAWRRAVPKTVGIAFVALLWLGGCRQALYTQLSEHEANEMLAVLALADIDVGKVQGEKHWGIEVPAREIPLAMQVLAREGLPRSRLHSMADLFKRETLVATPTEERVRFIHGTSQELSRTLSMIDGVLAARVHIVLPQNDPLADRVKASSASVFIRHRAEADLQHELTAIKSLVVRSVEGLTLDGVHVLLFAAQRPPERRADVSPAAASSRVQAGFGGDVLAGNWRVACIGLGVGLALASALFGVRQWLLRQWLATRSRLSAPR